MPTSNLLAERFAIDLNGVALGIWEAARLLDSDLTRDEGLIKVNRLRERLDSFQECPVHKDNLQMIINEEYSSKPFADLLIRLEQESYHDLLPEIKDLVKKTHQYVNDSRRTGAPHLWPI